MKVGGFLYEIGVETNQASFNKAQGALKGLGDAAKKLTGISALSATGLIAMAKAAASLETASLKTASSIGISTNKLDAWSSAVGAAGVNAASLTSSMAQLETKMQRMKLGEVDTGLAKSLGMMGMSYMSVANMDADQRMKAVFSQANKMGDQKKAAILVGDILGSGAKDYYEYLKLSGKSLESQLEEARKLTFTTEEDKKNAMVFQHEMKQVLQAVKSIGSLLGTGIAKELTPMVQKFKEYLMANKELIVSGITGFVKGAAEVFQGFMGVVSKIVPLIKKLVGYFGGLDKVIIKVGLGIAALKFKNVAVGILEVVKSMNIAKMAFKGLGLFALYKVLEDIMGFFTGKRSVTGLILAKIENLIPEETLEHLQEVFASIKESAQTLFDCLMDSGIIPQIIKIGDTLLEALGGALSITINKLGYLVEALAKLVTGDFSGAWDATKHFFKGDTNSDTVNFITGVTGNMKAQDLLKGGKNQLLYDNLKTIGLNDANDPGTNSAYWRQYAKENLIKPYDLSEVWEKKYWEHREKFGTKDIDMVMDLTVTKEESQRIRKERKAAAEEAAKNAPPLPDELKNLRNIPISPEVFGISTPSKINDGIISPSGHVTQVASDDWVFAMRDVGNLAAAFMPHGMSTVMNAPVTINQTFNVSAGARDMGSTIKSQAYKGTSQALLQNLNNSARILQLMPGTR